MFSKTWAFTVFLFTLALVIFVESLLTVLHSLHSTTESHLGHILPWVAGLEAIAALMLLARQTAKIGGFILLLIFILALVVHGPAEQMPLFVYAAGVILVMFRAGDRDKGSNELRVRTNETQKSFVAVPLWWSLPQTRP